MIRIEGVIRADRWQSPGLTALGLAVVMCFLSPGMATAGHRADANAAGLRALATVDSLLQVPAPEQAIAAINGVWASLGDHPVHGWQLEGRLGLALLLSGRPAEAVPHLEIVIGHDPRVAAHHRNLGAALLQLNRRGRALSEYGMAVELAPDDPELRREYGQLLLSFGDTRGAAKELLLAERLCQGCPEMDQPLASLYLMQEKFDQAVPPLQRLYLREPGSATRRPLVVAMSRAGNDSLLVKFISGVPGPERNADEWRLLVEGEGRLGIWAHSLLAADWLDSAGGGEVPAAVAGDDRFWGQVALNLLAAEKFKGGLAAVERAIDLVPDSVVYRNNKVVLLTRLGRDAEARVEWEKVLTLDPSLAP